MFPFNLFKTTSKPTTFDVFVLSLLTALITFHPFFMNGRINLFETGLYLPGIQAIFDGLVPYRDFFHLRGPFEIYMPTFLMKLFGVHINTLYAYFYFGNVLCLILCILIAKELFQNRWMLYIFVPVLIGRTWIRVVFAYWGGMRYAFGLLALWCLVKFFKSEQRKWIYFAGVAAACGFWTSVEIGIYPMVGLAVALVATWVTKLYDFKKIFNFGLWFAAGFFTISLPFGIYMQANGALVPYFDVVWTIVTRMQVIIDPHLVSIYPRNLPEALAAMLNPVSTNFKHMTPSYLYIIVLVYLIYRWRKKEFTLTDAAVVCLGIYGFVMYNTGFRGVWAAQFEMALQPEKVLLFFVLDLVVVRCLTLVNGHSLNSNASQRRDSFSHINPKHFRLAVNIFCLALILSSIGYSIGRFNHRFYGFQYFTGQMSVKKQKKMLSWMQEPSKALTTPRAQGVVVPVEQADDFAAIEKFINEKIGPNDQFLAYPELGIYHFLFNRPFPGRFPITTFSWFQENWHNEFMQDLKTNPPKFVILEKVIPDYWKAVYIVPDLNHKKFDENMTFILENYRVVQETPLAKIMERK